MAYAGETAYITGGARGIALYLAKDLVAKGMKVVLADFNYEGAKNAAKELNVSGEVAIAVEVDVGNWESQKKAFEEAVQAFGRINYVFPIAGITERPWLPFTPSEEEYVKPDLAVMDVNATGVLYTCALGIQHFQRQKPDKYGFRGKVIVVASACGFYYIPSLPVYTASKQYAFHILGIRLLLLLCKRIANPSSAIVGFVRTYGRHSPEEQITVNAVCPTIVKTGISVGEFYDKAEDKGLLVSVEHLVEGIESLLGDCKTSGEALEALPGSGGLRIKERAEYTNDGCRESVEMTEERTYNAFKALRAKAQQ